MLPGASMAQLKVPIDSRVFCPFSNFNKAGMMSFQKNMNEIA